jgi:predicted GNAT superfamily acetyltransferase
MRITRGLLAEYLPKMDELLATHWAEVGSHPNVRKLQIPREKYASLEEIGMLVSLFAHADDGTLVGYSINFLSVNMHSAETLVLQNDALYLAPQHRKGFAGIRLMRDTEQAARDAGAKLMVWHAKEQTNLDRLLIAQGYGVLDVLYSKEL